MSTRVIITGAAVLFVLAAPSFGAAAPVTYNDSTGDNPGGADIGAVTADLGADGKIAIELSIASMPQFGAQALAVVGIDTDRNADTGALFGGDYAVVFGFEELSLDFLRWDGSAYVDATGDVTSILGSGSVKIQVHPDAIGGKTAFNFKVGVLTGDPETGQVDVAPDAGSWAFEAKKVLTVDTVDAKFVPLAPRAGFVFQAPVVRITLSDGTTILAPKYRCVAQLGGKLLRGKGRGGCTFALPKNAKGKRLLVTLFVTYKGVTDEFKPYVFKVR